MHSAPIINNPNFSCTYDELNTMWSLFWWLYICQAPYRVHSYLIGTTFEHGTD